MRIRPVIGLSILAGLVAIALLVGSTAFSEAPTRGAEHFDVFHGDEEISAQGREGTAEEDESVATEEEPGTGPAARQPIAVRPPSAAPTGRASRRGSYTYVYDGKSSAVSGPPAPAAAVPPQYPVPGSGYSTGGYYDPFGFVRHDARYARPKPDPEMAKLLEADAEMEKQSKDLAEQYRKAADEKQRAELKTKLEALCDQHFDVRQKRRQREVAQLEEQLKRIRDSIDKRNEARELIVRIRVSELLGEEDELSF